MKTYTPTAGVLRILTTIKRKDYNGFMSCPNIDFDEASHQNLIRQCRGKLGVELTDKGRALLEGK